MPGIQRLLEIMAQLRNPEGGCPWDLQQDFESISPYTIEEAYEVDEAIARDDLEAIRDELGDLLFQVVFQSRIAEERGAFDFEDVIESIVSKLIRRHPHVFADAEVPQTLEAQTARWESMKALERAVAGRERSGDASPDPFEGVPRNLPALARSAKLAGRFERLAADTGQAVETSIEAHAERVSQAAMQAGQRLDGSTSPIDRRAALRLVGEGLRAWVGLARSLGVDPEQALRSVDDARIEAVRRNCASSRQHAPPIERVSGP